MNVNVCEQIKTSHSFRSFRHTLKIQYIPYMNTLAKFIGIKPNLIKLLVTDPNLFHACYFGPFTSYSFRLEGPNAWWEARSTILDTMNRINRPLQTRKIDFDVKHIDNNKSLWLTIICFSLIVVISSVIFN